MIRLAEVGSRRQIFPTRTSRFKTYRSESSAKVEPRLACIFIAVKFFFSIVKAVVRRILGSVEFRNMATELLTPATIPQRG